MVANTTMIHVRIDENIKIQAAETLASMCLTVSDAVRAFLTCMVADNELPFAIKAPNATSREALQETQQLIDSRRARFASVQVLINGLEKKQQQVNALPCPVRPITPSSF